MRELKKKDPVIEILYDSDGVEIKPLSQEEVNVLGSREQTFQLSPSPSNDVELMP